MLNDLNQDKADLDRYLACSISPTEADIMASVQAGEYQHVADIEVDKVRITCVLDWSYAGLQNTGDTWIAHDDVTFRLNETECRPSMIGDVYCLPAKNDFYIFDTIGFTKIEGVEIIDALKDIIKY